MASLLYKIGIFSARRAWLVITAWVLILASTIGLNLAFAGKLSSNVSLAGTPSQLVIDDLRASFSEASRGSGQVVFHKSNGQAFTAAEEAKISAALQTVTTLAGVNGVQDPFTAQAKLDKSRADLADGKKKLAEAPAKLADAQQKLDDGKAKLADGQKKLDAGRVKLTSTYKTLAAQAKQLVDAIAQMTAGGAPAEQIAALEANLAQVRAGEAQIKAEQAKLAPAQKKFDDGLQKIVEGQKKIDDALAELCAREGVDCLRGSLADVLDRFVCAARPYAPDIVVRLTGDCPLADPALIDEIVTRFVASDLDYLSNCEPASYPDGLDVEVTRFAALETAWREAVLPSHREHVTPFIRRQPARFRVGNHVSDETDRSGMRWTVDEPEDFEFVKQVYERLYPKNPAFSTRDVLALLAAEPALMQINTRFERNEGSRKSLIADARFLAEKTP